MFNFGRLFGASRKLPTVLVIYADGGSFLGVAATLVATFRLLGEMNRLYHRRFSFYFDGFVSSLMRGFVSEKVTRHH